ncbi:MAG: ankyrin repeat domain-containing protein [Actinomycetales bacterium]|nr:ankyrin repeat domain-containing protein [Actinomycetales bacterium]
MTDSEAKAIELAHRLFDAARNGDADLVQTYVTAGVPVNMIDSQGNSMLMLAAYHGQTQVVSVLIEAGADLNLVNDRGQSPLAGAVFKDESDVIALLVEAGADPDVGTPTARATADMFDRTGLFD